MEPRNVKPRSITIEDEIWKYVEEEAARTTASRSSIIRKLILDKYAPGQSSDTSK